MLTLDRDCAPAFAASWTQHERRCVRLAVEAVCCYFEVSVQLLRVGRTGPCAEARRWLVYLLLHDLGFAVSDVCALLARQRASLRSMQRTRRRAPRDDRRRTGALLRRLFAWQCRHSPADTTEDFAWYNDPLYGLAEAAAWRRDMDAFLTAPRRPVAVQERVAPPRLRQYMPCG